MMQKLRAMLCGAAPERGEVHDTVRHVFGTEMLLKELAGDSGSQRSRYVGHIKGNLAQVLDNKITAKLHNSKAPKKAIVTTNITDERAGRIGPKQVVFDASTGTGRMILVGDERVSVQGLSNFATIRATVCVFSGRWMYEVQIGTEGVMQIGWCTHACQFSMDAGVGDTPHSYAFDGGRVRRWNVATSPYGTHWHAGDVLGVCIDLEKGTVEFARNGTSMGTAFDSVYRGSGVAYFPAVSLATQEHLLANFGQVPFIFPIDGYAPMQQQPIKECLKAALLLESMEAVVDEAIASDEIDYTKSEKADVGDKAAAASPSSTASPPAPPSSATTESFMTKKAFLASLARILVSELSPLLKISYVVVAECLPRMRAMLGMPAGAPSPLFAAHHPTKFVGLSEELRQTPHAKLCRFLDWLWSFSDETLVCEMMEQCVVRQSLLYDLVSKDMTFSRQIESIYLICGLMEHAETRRHLVKYVLFGKVMFDNFLHVKRPEDEVLKVVVRHAWWKKPTPVRGESDPRIADEESGATREVNSSSNVQREGLNPAVAVSSEPAMKKSPGTWLRGAASKMKLAKSELSDQLLEKHYREDCDKITTAIEPLENLQVEMLLMMLYNTDGSDVFPSTRKIFLEKFRRYIMDNCILDMRLFSISRNTPAICWFCHARLLAVVLKLWEKHPLGDPNGPPHLPPRAFIDGTLDFYNVDRLGGVLPFLVRTLRSELVAVLGEDNAFVQSFEPRYNLGGGIDTGVSSTIDEGVGSPGLATLPQVISSIARFMNATALATPINRPVVETGMMKGTRSGMPGAGCAEPRTSMLLLIDGLQAMFHGSAVKYAEKLSELRDQQADLADCLHDIELRMSNVNAELHAAESKDLSQNEKLKEHVMRAITKELQRTKQVYEEKLATGSLQLAWTAGAVWSRSRQADLARLLAGTLHTVRLAGDAQYAAQQVHSKEVLPEKSTLLPAGVTGDSYASLQLQYDSNSDQSPDVLYENDVHSTPQSGSHRIIPPQFSGNKDLFPTELFPFVPDYYLESTLELCNTLRLFMHPTAPTSNIPEWEQLLVNCASLLCAEIADARVVLASARDSIVQTLASFATQPQTMRAIERVPVRAQSILIEELVRPYSGRSWAQSNWVLVRFWHGSGFGYRHRQWPHLAVKYGDREPTVTNLGAKVDAALMSQCFGPCPSELMQRRIGSYLVSNPEKTSQFLHSLLNQLHWAFSEFVNLMQEMDRSNSDAAVDSRQTKLCATCFDLYHSLCRALEMALHLAPTALTRPAPGGAPDLLLTRTCQMLMSVVSRTCSRSGGGGSFAKVTARGLPDMDRVHHYVALAPVAGSLVQLLDPTRPPEHLVKVTRALVTEPLFKLEDVEFMLGRHNDGVFSFYNYPDDVSEKELSSLEAVVERLQAARDMLRPRSTTSSMSRSDLLCTICYARVADTVFVPCRHHSCRSCVEQHLLNSKQCFFCKADIESVVEMEPGEMTSS